MCKWIDIAKDCPQKEGFYLCYAKEWKNPRVLEYAKIHIYAPMQFWLPNKNPANKVELWSELPILPKKWGIL